MNIFVVHEMCGGSILEASTCEEDAKNFLHWEEALGNICPSTYKITNVKLRN